MSTDRDVTGIVRSWLDEGVTALPDCVLDTVFDQRPRDPPAPFLVAGVEVPDDEPLRQDRRSPPRPWSSSPSWRVASCSRVRADPARLAHVANPGAAGIDPDRQSQRRRSHSSGPVPGADRPGTYRMGRGRLDRPHVPEGWVARAGLDRTTPTGTDTGGTLTGTGSQVCWRRCDGPHRGVPRVCGRRPDAVTCRASARPSDDLADAHSRLIRARSISTVDVTSRRASTLSRLALGISTWSSGACRLDRQYQRTACTRASCGPGIYAQGPNTCGTSGSSTSTGSVSSSGATYRARRQRQPQPTIAELDAIVESMAIETLAGGVVSPPRRRARRATTRPGRTAGRRGRGRSRRARPRR